MFESLLWFTIIAPILLIIFSIIGWEYLLILLFIFIIYSIIDNVKYPNKFRGKCKNCSKKHGRNLWWPNDLEQSYAMENGYVFLSKQCIDEWSKMHIICEVCKTIEEYSNTTLSHKFKRNYYYFCSNYCKSSFRREKPDLFYEGYKRHSIPSEIRKIVFNRDNGRCNKCGSEDDLQFDHILPVSKGGATTIENLEILCQTCNLSKSNKIE